MRELTSDEIDVVSAGPSAVTHLALVGQYNSSASRPAWASSGIPLAAGSALLSTDSLVTAN